VIAPLATEIRGEFPFPGVVDDVGAAMGLQKNLMASSKLEPTPSGDYHALTVRTRQHLLWLLYPDARDD
jgi:hypothetical protein